MTTGAIAVFNAGSSTLKFSLYRQEDLSLLNRGAVERITGNPEASIENQQGDTLTKETLDTSGHQAALQWLLDWIDAHDDDLTLHAAGHRIVHGGREFDKPVRLTPEVEEKLRRLTPLAPLHQPHNLAPVAALRELHPDLPQIGCFDTGFHHTQPDLAKHFALPRHLTQEGILRYGFHGISYDYIASILPDHAGEKADGRAVVAHLGNGASMCAMKERQSIATTMGFTALDGLMMGTRCGDLDPGVVLYLLDEKGMSLEDVTDLLYKQSGLKGVSGIGNDMRELLASDQPEAEEAVALYCYQAIRHLGALMASLGGLDVLVFTAGIGVNSPEIRRRICEGMAWAGLKLDQQANEKNAVRISTQDSAIAVYALPTNESLPIAQACKELL